MRKICDLNEIQDGQSKIFNINGAPIVIYRQGNHIYAFNNICTHEYCELMPDGYIEENVVTCPCHGAKFDITSGEVKTLPAFTSLPVYKVEVREGEVFVEV